MGFGEGETTPSHLSPGLQPLLMAFGGDQRQCAPAEIIHIVYVLLLLSKDCLWLTRPRSPSRETRMNRRQPQPNAGN